MVLIEVKNLIKRYGNYYAVNDVSFSVEKGQICGFLGPNGAGKTTTMNIMTGYIGLTEGEVIINGHSIQHEPNEAKRSIGYLPEHPPLYGDMTPREYIAFAAELKRIPSGIRTQEIEKVMEATKIFYVRNRLIRNLSKGYKQRVGLSQALLGFPEIIILDEPTAGLDPHQIIEMRELISSLANEHTVLLSSHILHEVQEICDQIIIIHRGEIVANGSVEELESDMRGTAIEITVKSESADDVVRILSSIEGVKQITCMEPKNGEVFAELEPMNKNDDLREAVFNACVRGNKKLLMLRPSSVSLESVFLQLTADNDPAIMKNNEKADNATSGGDEE